MGHKSPLPVGESNPSAHRLLSIAAALVVLAAVPSCSGAGSSTTKAQVTLGGPLSDAAALLYVAQDKGYFAANGLDVTLRQYATGTMALDALLNNEIDIAGSGEYPLVVKAFESRNISTIGAFSRSFNTYLVGKTGSGIQVEEDLKGKRIGLPLRTVSEFYLGRFLIMHGIDSKDVTVVNLTPAQAVDALLSEDIDAAVVWEPYVAQIEERATGGVVQWSVQADQPMLSILTCRNDWIGENPDTVKRFLKSLIQAERFVSSHPEDAKAILRDHAGYGDAYVAGVWPEHQFSVSLDQSLVLALEDEARWMASTMSPAATAIPDFLSFINADGLKAVSSEAVAITGK